MLPKRKQEITLLNQASRLAKLEKPNFYKNQHGKFKLLGNQFECETFDKIRVRFADEFRELI